jgi:hypothetical protein
LEEQSRTVSEPTGQIGSIDFFGPLKSRAREPALLKIGAAQPSINEQ